MAGAAPSHLRPKRTAVAGVTCGVHVEAGEKAADAILDLAVDMSADHGQLRPVVPTAVPLPLSLLRGDNEPEDQVVEIGRPEMKLASHVGRPRPLGA